MTARPFPTVSICLLNYRGAPFLQECLDALDRLDPAPAEIIAVDNASPDGSGATLKARAQAPRRVPMRFVDSGGNLGYAAGHNLGASHATGEYLAFLNITATPQPAWLEVARWMDEHPDVAFAQPAIFHRRDPLRVESLGSVLRPSGGIVIVGRNHREVATPPAVPYVGEVLSILGAIFVARRSAFEALGGFDPALFMYFEESDLCWRGWLSGQRSVCWFDPSRPTRAYHVVHGTHPKGFDSARYFERNRTLAMVRNLETRHLGWISMNVGTVVSETVRRPRALVRYGKEVVLGLPEASRRRRVLQANRRVGDDRLFALSAPADLPRWFVPPTGPDTPD
ncbi:MAG: glycosyltransferase family 2 protein [Thermoplasmata archaeon]|nr:glycosyltransferase family 2 protein [Thermoplasmata archaeon]